MTPEFQKKWCEALLSGEYPQTKGVLRNDQGYCCVGVALDLVDPKGWRADDAKGRTEYFWKMVSPNFVSGYGIDENIGLNSVQLHKLADMNDGRAHCQGEPRTFAEIAAHIATLPTETT